jgi:pyridoxamine 5'-phosphate oxidase family protein
MSHFTAAELAYIRGLQNGPILARIATVGADGTPHVVPVGWAYDPDHDAIEVAGASLTETKKFRDVERHGRAAIVIDDLATPSPWRPRGIEIRGRAEAVGSPRAVIRIHPERIVSWGLESARIGERYSRSV